MKALGGDWRRSMAVATITIGQLPPHLRATRAVIC
jgi:hypothetical protein